MGEMIRTAAKKPEAKQDKSCSFKDIGNQAVGGLIKSGGLQAKLRIGRPHDIYEQE